MPFTLADTLAFRSPSVRAAVTKDIAEHKKALIAARDKLLGKIEDDEVGRNWDSKKGGRLKIL